MNTRKLIFSIYSYLNDTDKLSVAATCKEARESMQLVPGPHKNIKEFSIAVSGIYKTQEEFKKAWAYYDEIIKSTPYFPAVLYRMNEFCKDEAGFYALNKHNKAVGCIYAPKKYGIYNPATNCGQHTWQLNYVWVKANIDLKRTFILKSLLSEENSFSTHHPDSPSAFAREIVIIMAAGYSLKFTGKGTLLVPPDKLEYEDLRISKEDIFWHYENLVYLCLEMLKELIEKLKLEIIKKSKIDNQHLYLSTLSPYFYDQKIKLDPLYSFTPSLSSLDSEPLMEQNYFITDISSQSKFISKKDIEEEKYSKIAIKKMGLLFFSHNTDQQNKKQNPNTCLIKPSV